MKIKAFINNLSMSSKIMLSFSIVIAIPVISSIFLMLSLKSITFENAKQDAVNSAERISLRVSQILETVSAVTYRIAYDSDLIDVLMDSYDSDYELAMAIRKYGNMNAYFDQSSGNLADINYYVDSVQVLNNGYIKNTPPAVAQTQWYQAAASGSTQSAWNYIENFGFVNKGTFSLALCRPLFIRNQFFGVLAGSVSEARLTEILSQEPYDVWIVSDSSLIVASNNPECVGRSCGDFGYRLEDFTENSSSNAGSKSSLVVNTLSIAGTDGSFHVVSFLPMEELQAQTNAAIRTALYIVVLGAVIAFVFLLLFSRLLTRRLFRLKESMLQITGDNLETTPELDTATDEIGLLSLTFRKMLENIRTLINEVYVAQLQKEQLENRQKEIQLEVLNNQMNPHFLFNALESIRMKAVTSQQDDIASAIRMLSTLLRKSLDTGSQPIPLSEELLLVQDYLDLQKFRFENQFEYRIDVFCDIDSLTIPPFTLQPIVENAIRHGFELSGRTRRKKSFVSITLMQENGRLLIRIADNGKGIDGKTLEGICQRLKQTDGDLPREHIGLVNVQRRIHLMYGGDYGVQITGAENRGTVVTVAVPLEEGDRSG